MRRDGILRAELHLTQTVFHVSASSESQVDFKAYSGAVYVWAQICVQEHVTLLSCQNISKFPWPGKKFPWNDQRFS
jgi:hypothetical protein